MPGHKFPPVDAVASRPELREAKALERATEREQLGHRALVQIDDESARIGPVNQQAMVHQLADGFADRTAADTKPAGKLGPDELGARRELLPTG